MEKKETACKKGFFGNLRAEFKKVIWPDKRSLAKQTIAVIVCSVLLGALIAIIDFVLRYGIDFLIQL